MLALQEMEGLLKAATAPWTGAQRTGAFLLHHSSCKRRCVSCSAWAAQGGGRKQFVVVHAQLAAPNSVSLLVSER